MTWLKEFHQLSSNGKMCENGIYVYFTTSAHQEKDLLINNAQQRSGTTAGLSYNLRFSSESNPNPYKCQGGDRNVVNSSGCVLRVCDRDTINLGLGQMWRHFLDK